MDKNKVLDRYRRLCSMREYCANEVMTKVTKALEGDEHAAAEVVASLIEDKYIDDSRYAEAFARDKAAIAGWGPVKIRFMLRSKGIPDEVIRTALEEIDAPKADERLEKLLENKYKTLKDDPQCRLKLTRFILGRGYQYADIAPLIARLTKNHPSED